MKLNTDFPLPFGSPEKNMDTYTPFSLTDLSRRPRRNRHSAAIRSLVQETHLHAAQFVMPVFVIEGHQLKEEIHSMPGIYRFSIDLLLAEVEELLHLGIKSVDIFCYTPKEKKCPKGSEAVRKGNLLQQAVYALKKEFPDVCVMADIALDPFTNHGHDGICSEKGHILNDETVEILAQMSLRAAEAGADIIAPSDMMDGRVSYIRRFLDQYGFTNVGILAYAAKYASSFYGPFRDALDSAPQFGDKKTYQMDPANSREALLECYLDEQEGADMLLIKPALAYLDIIAKVRSHTQLPIGAYHVSGEYSMVKAAAQRGWLQEDKVFLESLLCIKRAGADFILTYAAKQVAKFLKSNPL